MKVILILAALAAIVIVWSEQMLPYPPEPKITKDTFMMKSKASAGPEVVDRTHKGDRGAIRPAATTAKSTYAGPSSSRKSSFWYFPPVPQHCSNIVGCTVI